MIEIIKEENIRKDFYETVIVYLLLYYSFKIIFVYKENNFSDKKNNNQ